MSEQNKKTARRIFEEIESQGKLEVADEIFSSDFIDHLPLGEMGGIDGAKQFSSMLRTAFPDLYVSVEDQVAEGDRVATRFKARGTHKGEFLGVPASGKQMEITGTIFSRFVNGKIVEQWGNPDLLSLMQQIGAVPAMD